MNKYYPPDWDPSKGTATQFHKKKKHQSQKHLSTEYLLLEPDLHELHRERTGTDTQLQPGRKKSRIELPYNMWCDGCNRHLAKNLRFNSEKRQVGNYYRTAIWEFQFTCPSCPQIIVLQSDPKNQDYIITSGAKKQSTSLNKEDDSNEKINPFSILERKVEVEEENKILKPKVEQIKKSADAIHTADFFMNQLIRKEHRELRKIERKKAAKNKSLQNRYSLSGLEIDSVVGKDDMEKVGKIKFKSNHFKDIKRQSIFGKTNSAQRKSKESSSLLEDLDFCK